MTLTLTYMLWRSSLSWIIDFSRRSWFVQKLLTKKLSLYKRLLNFYNLYTNILYTHRLGGTFAPPASSRHPRSVCVCVWYFAGVVLLNIYPCNVTAKMSEFPKKSMGTEGDPPQIVRCTHTYTHRAGAGRMRGGRRPPLTPVRSVYVCVQII